MLTISLHVVDRHGLYVVQDPGVHVGDAGLDAADTNRLCLLLDGDLCTCGFVVPVESLTPGPTVLVTPWSCCPPTASTWPGSRLLAPGSPGTM